MSREIKFRAWDKIEQEIRSVIKIKFDSNLYDVMLLTPTGNAPNHWVLRNFDQIELMQFTGLKDKNGVEIYEGDILKWVAKNEDKKGQIFNNVVYFLEYRYRIKGTNNGKTFHCDLNSNHVFNHDCEVVGNIHENPIPALR